MRVGRFTRFFNVHVLTGAHAEYQHSAGGKVIGSAYGVAIAGDIICTGADEIRDMRTVFEMAVVDYETLKAGGQLLPFEDVHHLAVDRLWTEDTTEAVAP